MTSLFRQRQHFARRFFVLLLLLALPSIVLLGATTYARAQVLSTQDGSRVRVHPLHQEHGVDVQLPASNSAISRLFIPYFPNRLEGGRQAVINIFNEGNSTALYSVAFYGNNGSLITVSNGQIESQRPGVIEAPSQLGVCRCSAVLSSNQPFQAVVRIEQEDANGSALGIYRGASIVSFTPLFYAPFHAVNDGAQSELGIMNAGTSATSFTLDFFNFDGTPAGTHISGNVNSAQDRKSVV